MKINLKKINALLLAGTLTLSTMPKVKAQSVELTPEQIINMCEANVQKNISYEEYCLLCYNAYNYLNSKGLNLTLDELYAPIYVINYSLISGEVKNKIIENGFVATDMNLILNDTYKLFGMISTINHNVYLDALNNNAQTNEEKLVKSSNLCFDNKDRIIVTELEQDLTKYINTGKKDCELFTKIFSQFTNIPNTSEYSLEQATIGGRTLANLTTGGIFYSQISPMHPVDGMTIADDETLNSLSAYIHDISSLCNILQSGYQKIK